MLAGPGRPERALQRAHRHGNPMGRGRHGHPECVLSRKKNAPRLSNLNGDSEHGIVWLSAPADAQRDAQAIAARVCMTDPGRC